MHVVRVVGRSSQSKANRIDPVRRAQRRRIRWNVSFARHRFQYAQRLVGFFRFPSFALM